MTRPWMQVFTRDMMDDLELNCCSEKARFVLAWLMFLAHEGYPYGYLSNQVGPLKIEFLAKRLFTSDQILIEAIAELENAKRLKRNESGALYIPRMVKDEDVRLKRAAGGAKGGNPKLKEKVNLPSNLQGYPVSDARAYDSDSDIDSSSEVFFKETTLPNNGKRLAIRCGGILEQQTFEQFTAFRVEAEKAGCRKWSEGDWDEAYRFCWKKLDIEQRLHAVAGMQRRAGTDDECLSMLPKNYLDPSKQVWTREVRKPKLFNSKADARAASDAESDAIFRRIMANKVAQNG